MTIGAIATGLAIEALRRVGMEVTRELLARRDWKREHPCEVAVFHASMAASFSGKGVLKRIRRAWHRMRHRRWRAWCRALGTDRRCQVLSDSAARLVRLALDSARARDGNGPAPSRGKRRNTSKLLALAAESLAFDEPSLIDTEERE